jgi:hypothetical protein
MLCRIARRPAAPRSCASRSRRALGPVMLGGAALLLMTGCGQAASPAAAAPSTSSSSSSARSSMTAYLTCLRQHGVNVPTARPTVRPTARPSGGFGSPSAAMLKARQACAKLRPAGGFGFGGGGQFAAAFQAFRTCMASHGEAIPTTRPTAPPANPPASGAPRADRFLNGLNPANPKVAAALKACQSKLPTFPRPAGSPSAA